ncbi:hypothetical protein [Hazenella coriacea]|uniref:Uncharacterized protein n=1 Tax=Hazenella coriacea TaxID=1179467 RepID=A0A4R3L8R0_9BACL|nr:hypothetical protein [Hazenella coriacea]TCS95972.1 hypothetical protein EDD58_102556 [Hazenella coriacea]
MEVIAFLLLALFIAIVIIVNAFYRSARKKDQNRLYVIENLGIQEHSDDFKENLGQLIQRLEASIPLSYMEQVKERVIREHKISLIDWENRWFEWKRFLIMTAILKNVPMYSREVDEVWHEKLMFTREYELFSDLFLERTLHHAPHPPGHSFDRSERAWFDTIYIILFKPTKFSISTWGPFLKHPLSEKILLDFQMMPMDVLKEKYFNIHCQEHVPAVASLVEFIIRYFQGQVDYLSKHYDLYGKSVKTFGKHSSSSYSDPALWMLGGMLFLTCFHHDEFDEKNEFFEKTTGSGDSGGSFIFSGCSSGGDSISGDPGGDSGSGSSCSSSSCSSSSCSSCGGGCGSS